MTKLIRYPAWNSEQFAPLNCAVCLLRVGATSLVIKTAWSGMTRGPEGGGLSRRE